MVNTVNTENLAKGSGKKKAILILVIVVAVVVVLGILLWQSPSIQKNLGIQPIDKLHDVRNRTLLTAPEKVLSTTAQLGNTDVRFRIFDISMSKNGITPSEIIVNQGDRIQFNFKAIDGKYDVMVKPLGFYLDPVPQGQTSVGSFDTINAGDFPISCWTACPPGAKSANLKVLM
ncbi:MAG: hypothetical protein ABSF47_01400 [Minisyncoccia bacterium]|jgi:heme/copper-type cytochrome/quinol oxidase subunit 2